MHVGTRSEPIGTRAAITGSAQCKIMTYMTVKERGVAWGLERRRYPGAAAVFTA